MYSANKMWPILGKILYHRIFKLSLLFAWFGVDYLALVRLNPTSAFLVTFENSLERLYRVLAFVLRTIEFVFATVISFKIFCLELLSDKAFLVQNVLGWVSGFHHSS